MESGTDLTSWTRFFNENVSFVEPCVSSGWLCSSLFEHAPSKNEITMANCKVDFFIFSLVFMGEAGSGYAKVKKIKSEKIALMVALKSVEKQNDCRILLTGSSGVSHEAMERHGE